VTFFLLFLFLFLFFMTGYGTDRHHLFLTEKLEEKKRRQQLVGGFIWVHVEDSSNSTDTVGYGLSYFPQLVIQVQ